MTAKLNFVSVDGDSIRAYATCTLRSQPELRKSLTNWIRTLCCPAPSEGPTGYVPYCVALTIVVSPTAVPSTVTRIVGQPWQLSPIAPTSTRPPPLIVVVA
jgi:hypothetical protein